MTNELPLVSVLIPAYNHMSYVRQSIESVLKQTYSNIELIVIDDGSTDSSRQIIEEVLCECGNSFLFITRPNKGLLKTFEEGFSYMHGEYICFLASDDYWDPAKIKYQVSVMQQDPNIAICFTNYYNIDRESKIINEVKPLNYKKKYTFIDVLYDIEFPPASMMMRKKSLINNQIFDYDVVSCVEDLYLWLYILQQGGYAIVINKTLAYYRNHAYNTRYQIPIKMLNDHYSTIEYFSRNLKGRKRILSIWALRNASQLSRIHKKESLFYLKKCINRFYSPIFIKTIIKLLFF
jgi:alpha-1,3-rhamnosyltransferase